MRRLRRIACMATLGLATVTWVSAAIDAPVADAAMRLDAGAVRALLADGADVDAAQGDGMTGLHWAARHGATEIVTPRSAPASSNSVTISVAPWRAGQVGRRL